MNGFDECRHVRDRAGKFTAYVGAEQEGTLTRDPALSPVPIDPMPTGTVDRGTVRRFLNSVEADPVDAEDAIYDARLRQCGAVKTSRGWILVHRDGDSRDPEACVYRLELDDPDGGPDAAA